MGELSGIDHDSCTGDYVLISDDSAVNSARFYTARIRVDDGGVAPVEFTGMHPFRRPDGTRYPPPSATGGKAVDPEDIWADPRTCEYWWSQEGSKPKTPTAPDPIVQPSIQRADHTGGYLGQLRLPSNYEMSMQEHGPRRNLVLEAITFGESGRVLTVGTLAKTGPTVAWPAGNRITVR